ncbi:axonemal dynein light chain domain-containing protein 1 [Rhinophrynus dorsalis]
MSVTEFPSSPAEPRPTGRKVLGSRSPLSLGEESTEILNVQQKCTAVQQSQPLKTSHRMDFIPDEILQVLTSCTAPERSDLSSVKNKTATGAKVCLRSTDQVWHHPLRRSKFKHLTEQPVCLTGAGRDISFLCDALLSEKRSTTISSLQPITRRDEKSTEGDIGDSLIPKEYYVVKSKGVLGLEYYEDKYTTILEDDEKKLRLFPSMKPSGRAEVLQLMKVMDSMLKDAGVDEEDLQLEGPTQIHNLLELLKTEQNIYNIVFHELIRQVSVECVERGELLAKLRQRYVMLLDKVPRQVLKLYSDLLAQRALDRCLTEEIIHFRNAIGEMTNELCQVREHDLRVSKDARQAQAELAKALKEAEKNANLLEEYRELYELQRSRLEKHLVHLTEERDLWSGATYRLAKKVIEENQLHLARKLYMCEKSWTKVIRHFILLLASTDTKDLSLIQQTTEAWRGQMVHIEKELQRNEGSSREKIRLIQCDLVKWLQHFQEKVFGNEHFKDVPNDLTEAISQDLKRWEKMLTEELQRFEGDLLLSSQESLKIAGDIEKQWVELSEKVLRRHQSLNGAPSPELKAMEDLKSSIQQLCELYRRRLEGDNGVARALMFFSSSLKSWSLQMDSLRNMPYGIRESDWINFSHLISEWINHADQILGLIGSPYLENEPNPNADEKMLLEDIFRMLQHWVLSMSSGTERDNQQLTNEVANLHTAMVQFLVNVLMLLSPNCTSDSSDMSSTPEFGEESFTPATIQKMQEEVLILSEQGVEKRCLFHGAIQRRKDKEVLEQVLVPEMGLGFYLCCQEMAENISLEKPSLIDEEDPDHELNELETIKSSCNEWIETCQLLLSDVTRSSLNLSNIKNFEVILVLVREPSTRETTSKDDHTQPDGEGDPQEVKQHDNNIQSSSHKAEKTIATLKDYRTGTRREYPQEETAVDQDVMRIIGHDGNIHKKSLIGKEIPVSSEGVLTASRPGTPKSVQAFESLVSLENLQKLLLHTEQRAQKAEERSESLDEQLKAALQKIRELEKIHVPDESSSKVEGKTVTSFVFFLCYLYSHAVYRL